MRLRCLWALCMSRGKCGSRDRRVVFLGDGVWVCEAEAGCSRSTRLTLGPAHACPLLPGVLGSPLISLLFWILICFSIAALFTKRYSVRPLIVALILRSIYYLGIGPTLNILGALNVSAVRSSGHSAHPYHSRACSVLLLQLRQPGISHLPAALGIKCSVLAMHCPPLHGRTSNLRFIVPQEMGRTFPNPALYDWGLLCSSLLHLSLSFPCVPPL